MAKIIEYLKKPEQSASTLFTRVNNQIVPIEPVLPFGQARVSNAVAEVLVAKGVARVVRDEAEPEGLTQTERERRMTKDERKANRWP